MYQYRNPFRNYLTGSLVTSVRIILEAAFRRVVLKIFFEDTNLEVWVSKLLHPLMPRFSKWIWHYFTKFHRHNWFESCCRLFQISQAVLKMNFASTLETLPQGVTTKTAITTKSCSSTLCFQVCLTKLLKQLSIT